jgi:hypothetical protein
MPDVLQAIGQDVREEPAEKRQAGKGGGAGAGMADFPRAEGDRAVCEAHETAGGESDREDRGGAGGAGRVAVVVGLTLDVPGEGPDLGGDILQQSGGAQGVFAEGAGEGGEGCDGDKAVGAGGEPRCAVRGAAPARPTIVEVRRGLERSAPGVQDAGAPGEGGPAAPGVLGQPFESCRRGVAQGLVRGALRRAEAGAERVRDGASAQAGGPGPLVVEVVLEPLRGCLLRTLGAVAGWPQEGLTRCGPPQVGHAERLGPSWPR